MASFKTSQGISDVLAVPLGDLIAEVGRSVAEAQCAIDQQAIDNFRAVYDDSEAAFEALRSIGYEPTWYQIPEATAKIAIALTVSGSGSGQTTGKRSRIALYGAPVDAGYQTKFNYGIQGSSSLEFRIVPVPPPVAATRMRVAPNLVGRSLADARPRLEQLDIPCAVQPPDAGPTTKVARQSPEAGELLAPGAALSLFADPAVS
jgi:hypothetical protein